MSIEKRIHELREEKEKEFNPYDLSQVAEALKEDSCDEDDEELPEKFNPYDLGEVARADRVQRRRNHNWYR